MPRDCRNRDEMHLRWVRLRCAGKAPSEIAREDGCSASTVTNATCFVRRDDEAQAELSGEDLTGRYWRDGRRKSKE